MKYTSQYFQMKCITSLWMRNEDLYQRKNNVHLDQYFCYDILYQNF